ncbi:hypothetical protein [Dapis sp. BLCC M229]|uniref:hypothetical protein n=1 Tax=Dapis sp. BLCC M229 TaxID=3400188 RepID=UPI003CEFFC20
MLTASIASCTISAFSDTWWNKSISYFNAEVAKKVNGSDSPILLTDLGDDYTNTANLISFSYILDDKVRLLLLSKSPNLEMVENESEIFVFQPSGKLGEALKATEWEFESTVDGELWRVKKR